MAIDLTGSPDGLFKSLGAITYALDTWNTFRGTTLATLTTNIDDEFTNFSYVIDGLYQQRDSARSSMSGFPSYLSQLAQTTLIEQANTDTPLASKTVSNAMTLLITQMIGAGSLSAPTNDVDANTVSATPTVGSSNTGTATCAASCVGPDGRPREYVIAETLTLTATTDSQSGSATEGRETWAITAPAAQGDQLSWDWPKGSGTASSVTASSPDGTLNKLVNGDFEDFTTNDPDFWDILVGAAGTDIDDEATNFYQGAKALKITGDGSTLSAIRQKFNDGTNGTSYKLLPNTVYAVSYWVKMSSTPAAGVLAVSLIDSGGSIITNDFGTSQTITKALTGVSTSWVNVTGFFQTPKVLNSTQYSIKLHLTTALSNTKVAYIDSLQMVVATEAYKGGPYLAVFSGATATVKGDTITVAVANDWAGAFQKAFQRFFNMRQLGLQLPSDTGGTETINDAWIA